MSKLQRKTALVTGAASGIGRATAQALQAEGARVAGIDRDAFAPDHGLDIALKVDVTDPEQLRAAVAEISDNLGPIVVLANCAGVSPGPFAGHEMPDDVWALTVGVNLTGSFNVCRAVIPGMLAAGGGSINNIGSVMSKVGNPGYVAYVASKAGVLGLTRSLALDYAQMGIRVNTVCPGFIETPMVARSLPDDPFEAQAVLTSIRDMHPVGRLGRPEEIAAAVLWLAADASFVTGSEITVDGGFTAR